MRKRRSFILGVLFGCLLCASATYAAEEWHIEFPSITYWLDGTELELQEGSQPSTIRYENAYYVSVRSLQRALGYDVEWMPEKEAVHIRTMHSLPFEIVKETNVTDPELLEWIKRSRDRAMTQVRTWQGQTYVLLTMGAQTTGGYQVHTEKIEQFYDSYVIHYRTEEPDKYESLIEEVTYPYQLIRLGEKPKGIVKFKRTSGELTLPGLQGISYLPDIHQQSKSMIVFPPQQQDGKWSLSGICQSFEGVVSWEHYKADGQLIQSGHLDTATPVWKWGAFELQLAAEMVEAGDEIRLFTQQVGPEALEMLGILVF
ncbi:protease complex subunit PrcB family protein [Marinicrinis sediminis]|uniref:Protease complex subunit PrcB family protein n=1 Tax=Marinicrinis sediminis TaxID=1652465 RepID=A0ABW5R9N3_9BACL